MVSVHVRTPPVRMANTYQSNQWPVENFWNQVDIDAEQEFQAASEGDKPVDRLVIRDRVIGAIVTYAIPAGNA